jgi:hypothetical protein
VKLDSIGDGKPMPAEGQVIVVGNRFVSSGVECRREGQGNLPLERVTSDVAHLTFDGLEALPFALPNLDGE